jgi:glutathione synthase/RimK-type ligase-like ATP-grasp enzyme
MTSHIVVVENQSDWQPHYPDAVIVTAKEYLSQPDFLKTKGIKVLNLCRSYRYLSIGYYVSLLGEARRHKVIPSVHTVTDLSSKAIYSLNFEDLDSLVHKTLEKRTKPQPEQNRFELQIFFGRCEDKELQDLARQLFATFRCPLLKVEFRFQGKWEISSIRPIQLQSIAPEQQPAFIEALNHYFSKPWRSARARSVARYDLAILHNPEEKLPPSSPASLQKFIKAGRKFGIDVELIERKDFARLAEYDALFIRETTKIDHYTYRFAKKAESEGMVVIDDPDSIVKCTNKVYLAELLTANRVPVPKTVIVNKSSLKALEESLQYPVVLKIPDGSFSRGVFKAENEKDLFEIVARNFKDTDLLLAQEYLYTPFDWRIGVLNRKAIYACQYFMSKSHWQIVKHNPSGNVEEGLGKTWLVEDAPKEVVDVALRAANLIGNGLYGVDVKQTERGVFVIEVNDNPNIDKGFEDVSLGDEMYNIIMAEFARRLDLRKQDLPGVARQKPNGVARVAPAHVPSTDPAERSPAVAEAE